MPVPDDASLVSDLSQLDRLLDQRFPALARELRAGMNEQRLRASWAERYPEVALPAAYLELHRWHDGTERSYSLVPEAGAFVSAQWGIELYDQYVRHWDAVPTWGRAVRGVPVLFFEGAVTVVAPDGALYVVHQSDPVPVFDSIPAMVRTVRDWYEAGAIVVEDELFAEFADEALVREIHARWNPRSDRTWPPL